MSIESERDLMGLSAAARTVRAALDAMRVTVRPGVTTAELDAVGSAVLRARGGRSAPMAVYGFPAETLISVNDEIVHGVPGGRVIGQGDVVKLDVTVEQGGYVADAAITVVVEPASRRRLDLARCARSACAAGIAAARAGRRVKEIGRAVEQEVGRWGFSVVRALTGHGVGRTIHEPPTVPNYDDPRADSLLTEGLVLTVEPLVASGSGRATESDDGWTVRTADGSPAAHHEETIVVTRGRPLILTATAT